MLRQLFHSSAPVGSRQGAGQAFAGLGRTLALDHESGTLSRLLALASSNKHAPSLSNALSGGSRTLRSFSSKPPHPLATPVGPASATSPSSSSSQPQQQPPAAPPPSSGVAKREGSSDITLDPSKTYTLPSLRAANRAPSIMELRRAQETTLGQVSPAAPPPAPAVPRKYEETATNTAKSWLYNAMVLAIAGLTILVLRAVVFDEGKKNNQLLTIAAQLRKHRAAAKKALLEAATITGEVATSKTSPTNTTKAGGDSGSNAGRRLKYYISGDPSRASKVVLLHAEDGETAAMWGFVHSLLSHSLSGKQEVCVVTFHHEGIKRERGTSRALTLRAHDCNVMLKELDRLISISKNNKRPKRASNREVVLVTHGEGAWGNLAFAAMHAPTSTLSSDDDIGISSGGGGGSKWTAAGSVCVAPMVMHRGQSTAWWEAVAWSSRYATTRPSDNTNGSGGGGDIDIKEGDGGYSYGVKRSNDVPRKLLEKFMAPPPLTDLQSGNGSGNNGNNGDGRGSKGSNGNNVNDAALLKKLDDSNKRRAAAVQMGENLGLGSASDEDEKSKRLAEDFRRARAKEPVLARSDAELLSGLWGLLSPSSLSSSSTSSSAAAGNRPSAGSATSGSGSGRRPVPVSVVTHGHQSLPAFIKEAQRLPLQYWWLQGALACGVFSATPSQRSALAAFRATNTADIVAELSGGQLTTSTSASSSSANKGTGGSDNAGDDAYSLVAMSGSALKETAAGSLAGADAETRFVQRAFRQIPAGLGLGPAVTPVDQSFTYLAAQREMRLLSASSTATGSDSIDITSPSSSSVSPASNDFSITLVQGPTLSCQHACQGQTDTLEGAQTLDTVAHIPLQAPQAVADEVLNLLGLAPAPTATPAAGAVAAPAAASDATSQVSGSGGAGRRFKQYGQQRALEAIVEEAEARRKARAAEVAAIVAAAQARAKAKEEQEAAAAAAASAAGNDGADGSKEKPLQ